MRSTRTRLGAVALLVAWLAGCVEAEPPTSRRDGEPSAALERPEGHRRMVALLAEIKQRTPDENHWLGDRGARVARAKLEALPGTGPMLERFRLTTAVAEHEQRLGNEREAIRRFEEANALVPELERALSQEDALEAVFRLGIAYLRYGETQNCAVSHTAQSCILPIREGGVHADREGSTKAIQYFAEVLARTPRTSVQNLKAVWLLNLAYMTLGAYPDGVPAEYRIPPAVFGAEETFPHFPNVAPRLGVATPDLSGGAVLDDLDEDGWLDLFTTTFDTSGEPHLFHNRGDGTFVDRSQVAGLAGLYGGLNVIDADYDNDGDLDLYVLRGAWLESAGRYPDSLLRNDSATTALRAGAKSIVFTDVTFDAGLGEVHYPSQTGAWADYDNDGDVDLFVGNEHGSSPIQRPEGQAEFEAPCQLFRNNGDGTFTDVAKQAGVDARAFVKGVVFGDYDNDRFPDLYLSVLGGDNRLYHNQRDGTFRDVAPAAGVVAPYNSFPVWFWDYDNDGNLDLYVASYRGARDGVALVAASYFGLEVPWDMARLYRGDGRGGFVDIAQRLGLVRLHLPMGSNFGDVDNDGFLDFYLGTGYPDYEGLMPNVLYHNEAGERFRDVTWPAGVGHLQKGHGVAFGDYDNDGDVDIFAQMGGAFPGDGFADALFQNPGFGNHWLALELHGTVSNRAAIGARIRVDVLEAGRHRSIYRHVGSGGSFGCNSLRQTIGLGKASSIEGIEIYWPTSDTTEMFRAVAMDRFYQATEGEATLVEPGWAAAIAKVPAPQLKAGASAEP